MGFKSDDGTQAPAAVTAESYNGDYLAFWPPGGGSNNMWTSITNCAPVPADNKFWWVTTSGKWKGADIVNEKFDLGEVIPGGGQKGVILNEFVAGKSIQLIFWPATATTPEKLWKSNTVPSGNPLAHRSFAQYKRAATMKGTTMCAVTSDGGFQCTNPDGGKEKGVFYGDPAKQYVWIWQQAAMLLSSLGPIYFPGSKVIFWKTLEPFTTINANAYCGNAAIRPSKLTTILEPNAGVNKCARWVQSNSACGSDFHYSPTTFFCECAPRGTSCEVVADSQWGYSAHHFDSAASEVARRISLNPDGKRGTACTMSLSWNTEDDLDLYLTGAYTVDYSHEKTADEKGKVVAELNIDANYKGIKTSTPVENIITNVPKIGTYTLKVGPEDGPDTPYDIVVVCHGAKMDHDGKTIQRGEFISASGVADSAIAAIEFEVVE